MKTPNLKLDHYAKFWDLELLSDPIQTSTGLVAFTKDSVLKIGINDSEEQTALALQHYNGNGAVHILKHEDSATLMERANPGTLLSELDDYSATNILCDVIAKLHSNKTLADFPTIGDLQIGFKNYINSGDTQIPSELVFEANETYTNLLNTQATPIVLHGDMHHENVIYDETRGWLAIDPKGYIGEPTYEIGAMLRNPINCHDIINSPEMINQRVNIICERLGFERSCVLGWAFAQAVLSAIWSIEDNQSPEWFIEVAKAIKNIQ